MRVAKLSKRDLDIMHYLSFGVSTLNSLGRRFFPRRGGNGKSFDGSKPVDNPSDYAKARIRQLKKGGFLKAAMYSGDENLIVTVSNAGAQKVVLEFGEEMENIKCELPKLSDLDHDIMMSSSMIKICLDESRHQRLYTVNWRMTEQQMRLNSGKSKRRSRNIFYPDFRMSLSTPASSQQIFNFLVDGGNMGRSVVFEKVASFKGTTLIITKTTNRLNVILAYLRNDGMMHAVNSKGTIARLPDTVLVVIWEDFLRRGCKGASFHHYQTGQIARFPLIFP